MILLVLLSVGLMMMDHRERLGDPVRQVIQTATQPIHYAVSLPFDLAEFAGERLASRSALIAENARLRDQQLLYQARLQRLDALEKENIRLQGLLGSAYEVEDAVLIAELMRVDLDPYRHLLRVDKGSASGVFTGQPVIDADGVMGQVDSTGLNSAVVRLITDPSHATPVQVNRNGLRAIAFGTGNLNELELPHLPTNADIERGDLLVTSGLGGRFPRGYPVARVTGVERLSGRSFAEVTAAPLAQLGRSREMLLIRSDDDGDAEPLRPDAMPETTTPPDGEEQP